MIVRTKRCKACQLVFHCQRSNALFCSPRCRTRTKRKREGKKTPKGSVFKIFKDYQEEFIVELSRGEKLDSLVQLMISAEKRSAKLHYGRGFQVVDKHAVAKSLIDGDFSVTEGATAIAEYYEQLDGTGSATYALWHGRLGFWKRAYLDGALNIQHAIATRAPTVKTSGEPSALVKALSEFLAEGGSVENLQRHVDDVIGTYQAAFKETVRKEVATMLAQKGLKIEDLL